MYCAAIVNTMNEVLVSSVVKNAPDHGDYKVRIKVLRDADHPRSDDQVLEIWGQELNDVTALLKSAKSVLNQMYELDASEAETRRSRERESTATASNETGQ